MKIRLFGIELIFIVRKIRKHPGVDEYGLRLGGPSEWRRTLLEHNERAPDKRDHKLRNRNDHSKWST